MALISDLKAADPAYLPPGGVANPSYLPPAGSAYLPPSGTVDPAYLPPSGSAYLPPSAAPNEAAVLPPGARSQRSEADLEKLAAPIALYPDPLLAVLLPASVYPLEITLAARFVSDSNHLARVDEQPWDANVKELAQFPEVIQKLNNDLGWTVELGQAFTEQQLELMNAIQTLRSKAQSVGSLKTTPEQVVVVTNAVVERTVEQQVVYITNTVVQIEPSNPQVVYVPQYSAATAYSPPPPSADPLAPLVSFGVGMALGAAIANNHCDWHYGGVYMGGGGMVIVGGGGHPYRPPPAGYRPPPYRPPPGYRPPPPGSRPPGYPPPGSRPYAASASGTGPQRWQPDPNRVRSSGVPAPMPSEARGWSRDNAAAGRPSVGTTPGRSLQTPSAGLSRSAGGASGDSAFSALSSGSSARASSSRGLASRGGGGRGGRR